MFEQFYPQLIAAANEESPKELCGYLVRDEHGLFFHKAENIIPFDKKLGLDPCEAFAISLEERAHVESLGEIVCLVHSHTNANPLNGKHDFSSIDRAACNRGSIPWLLVTVPDNQVKILEPTTGEVAPLLGRSFFFGVWDCYSLLRDVYAEIGIQLNDYPRQSIAEQQQPQWNLYEENFTREGFVEVPKHGELKKYDLLFMMIDSDRINHAGVMWDVNRNIFIQHLVNRLSNEYVYGGYWEKVTVKVARHKSLM